MISKRKERKRQSHRWDVQGNIRSWRKPLLSKMERLITKIAPYVIHHSCRAVNKREQIEKAEKKGL